MIHGEEKKVALPKHEADRNDPCPCGSGKKYKKCCMTKVEADRVKFREALASREMDEKVKGRRPIGS